MYNYHENIVIRFLLQGVMGFVNQTANLKGQPLTILMPGIIVFISGHLYYVSAVLITLTNNITLPPHLAV